MEDDTPSELFQTPQQPASPPESLTALPRPGERSAVAPLPGVLAPTPELPSPPVERAAPLSTPSNAPSNAGSNVGSNVAPRVPLAASSKISSSLPPDEEELQRKRESVAAIVERHKAAAAAAAAASPPAASSSSPSSSPAARPASHPLPLPQGQLSVADYRRVIEIVETRIARCEAMLGDPRSIQESRKLSREKVRAEVEESGDGIFNSVLDERRRKWESSLDYATAPNISVGAQAARILTVANEALKGEPATFDAKLSQLQQWLDRENSSVSMLLTSYATQRTCVLAHESEIKELAGQFKMLEDLKEYANPSSFAPLSAQRERINALATRAFLLSNRANLLARQVEETVAQYTSAINLFGATVASRLLKSDTPVVASKATRKSVGFG